MSCDLNEVSKSALIKELKDHRVWIDAKGTTRADLLRSLFIMLYLTIYIDRTMLVVTPIRLVQHVSWVSSRAVIRRKHIEHFDQLKDDELVAFYNSCFVLNNYLCPFEEMVLISIFI
jgi:hypothetical protein